MKQLTNVFTYLAAIAIGVLLLIFHAAASMLSWIVIVIGIVILVPSLFMLVKSFFGPKNEEGKRPAPLWYLIVVCVAGLALGLWMLINPEFFIRITVYTLAAVLILSGIAGIVFVVQASRPGKANKWWYLIPVATIVGGLVLIFLGATAVGQIANLVTGILLVVYGVNGFAALGREQRHDGSLSETAEPAVEEEKEEETTSREAGEE